MTGRGVQEPVVWRGGYGSLQSGCVGLYEEGAGPSVLSRALPVGGSARVPFEDCWLDEDVGRV